jgi:UDP-2,3-diacylglucosamine pyrophosphatase LpxH
VRARFAPTIVVLTAAAAVLTGNAVQTQPNSGDARTLVLISDLHMGEGRTGDSWAPEEDFRWGTEFTSFLDAVNVEGKSAVDLVLNGDTFELAAPDSPCKTGDVNCGDREALTRLNRVLAAHATEIKALARFASAGSNRVSFVPGDQDAALARPAIAQRLLEILALPSNRAQVVASGRWASDDRRIVAEHGHEVVAPEPSVRAVFNRLETQYPAVDNIAALGNGLRYAIAAAGGVDAALMPQVVRALLLVTPWQQFRMELDDGEVDPPVWDLAQVRKQGAPFLLASFPDDDPLKPLVLKASNDGLLSLDAPRWTDDELGTVCDYRAALRRARRRYEPVVTQFAPRGPAVAECPRTPETRGAQFDYFWQSRDRAFTRHLQKVALEPARISVLVIGHTHLADRSQTGANMISGGLLKIPMEGFSPVRGALTPIVINGGAWQRTMTPVQYERIRNERSATDDQLLRSLQPEQLTPCYSFVRIAPYATDPAPTVRYWREADGSWGLAASCGR